MAEGDDRYCLRLRLPKGLGEKHVFLTGVRFAYGGEQFEESLANGRALSYRFLHDQKGWRVFVSAEGARVKRITDN